MGGLGGVAAFDQHGGGGGGGGRKGGTVAAGSERSHHEILFRVDEPDAYVRITSIVVI